LALEAISCRTPSRVYSLFLHDQWTSFKIRRLAAGQVHEVRKHQYFIDMFFFVEYEDQDLLCVLYPFNFLLQGNARWDPNPYVGDIQLWLFSSFILNHINWKKSIEFYTMIKLEERLMIRDEYPLTNVIMDDYYRLKQELMDFIPIRYHQDFFITYYQEITISHFLQELLVSHDLWDKLPNYPGNKNQVGLPYLSLSLNRASFYANSFMRHGARCIGLIFHYPVIWCPSCFYKAPTKWEEQDKLTYWTRVIKNLGYYDRGEFGHLAFNWGDIHVHIPE